jgi:flagellar biosynthesis anti-sigma factor FlgM
LKISTEEVTRIMQAGRLNRTNLMGPKGYGRPVEPRHRTKTPSETNSAEAEVLRVKALVDALPDVREEQVQALKARIESGTYVVNSEDIADLIVRRAWADSMR